MRHLNQVLSYIYIYIYIYIYTCVCVVWDNWISDFIPVPCLSIGLTLCGIHTIHCSFNVTNRPRSWNQQKILYGQNGRHFADGIFKRIFVDDFFLMSNESLLQFVPKGPINNISALEQIMAWRRPLSEPMMVSLSTYICANRPQCVKSLKTLGYIHTLFSKIWIFCNV